VKANAPEDGFGSQLVSDAQRSRVLIASVDFYGEAEDFDGNYSIQQFAR
jgi:hypothetical protein